MIATTVECHLLGPQTGTNPPERVATLRLPLIVSGEPLTPDQAPTDYRTRLRLLPVLVRYADRVYIREVATNEYHEATIFDADQLGQAATAAGRGH